MKALLEKSAPEASVAGKVAAEKAVTATRAAITGLESGGAAADDEILVMLRSRLERQRKEPTKLTDKEPTSARKKQALVVAREDYIKAQQTATSFAEKGAIKATTRAQ